MHIVQTLSIETTNYVHDVLEYYCSMERSRLRRVPSCVDFHEPPLFNIKLVDIVESLLICVNSAKNVYVATTYDGRVPVPGLWW